ncbi:unnamed protein product, partial [Rangifer tarandus platyrhynchus]
MGAGEAAEQGQAWRGPGWESTGDLHAPPPSPHPPHARRGAPVLEARQARWVLAGSGGVWGRGGVSRPPGCRSWQAEVRSRVVRLKCRARPVESCGWLARQA